MANVEGATNPGTIQEHDEHFCTKYGFYILIIFGSYGGHR